MKRFATVIAFVSSAAIGTAWACPNMAGDKDEAPRTAEKTKDSKDQKAKEADKAKDPNKDQKPASDQAKKDKDAKKPDKVSTR
jgi:hypothetical protein